MSLPCYQHHSPLTPQLDKTKKVFIEISLNCPHSVSTAANATRFMPDKHSGHKNLFFLQQVIINC